MIDLHTHTTASDGRRTPPELVACAAAAGVTVLSVTDHDTMAACAPAQQACARAGIEFVPGIEITAIRAERDVHVLGYFIDVESAALLAFLSDQRKRRLERVRQVILRLGLCGIDLDAGAILQPAIDDPARAVGRPWVARALVEHGCCATIGEAFDRWLSRGRPAYVARPAAPPEEVVARIHEAGGVASIAHPVLLGHDEWIPDFVSSGLDAIEAYHTRHDPERTTHYLSLAARLGVAVSGGSDYHADDAYGALTPGSVALPPEQFATLKARRRTNPDS